MILKIFLKIWPSLIPIFSYIIWVYIVKGIIVKFALRMMAKRYKVRQEKIINGEYEVVGSKSTRDIDSDLQKNQQGIFSLKNPTFVAIIYFSLILLIISFLLGAIA